MKFMRCLQVNSWSLLLLVLAAGCGESLGTPAAISGKVTLNGQPVADANITFHGTKLPEKLPAEFRSRMAKTDAQGAYTLAEVYPGEYQVMVQKFASTAGDPGKAPAAGAANDPLKAYGADSKLTATIGPNNPKEVDFKLP